MTVIAIVEDSTMQLISLKRSFQAAGYHVDTYADPVVALPKLIFTPPNLLILNGHMPGMHGIDFFLKFRQYSSAPVVFLSASAEEIHDHLDQLGVSAHDYVQKPASAKHLLMLTERVLRSPRQFS